jgi:transcriptional regulator with XRE-family HTH domain
MPAERGATDVKTVVGLSIVALRRAAGLTQEELAAAMAGAGFRWTRTTVAEIETSVRSVTIEELVAVSSFFEVPPAFVLAGAGLPIGAVQIGGAVLSRQELIDVVTDWRAHESAPPEARKAIDRIWRSTPRRWAQLWRRGGNAGPAFARAREEKLTTRERFPGPTYVVTGDDSLASDSGGLWGTALHFEMQPGVPYVARDEAEADQLAKLEAQGQVRRIKPYEAYRMRQRRKQR